MLVIRLSRVGRSKKNIYRIIVQQKTAAPKSKAIEIVGSYNPLTNPATTVLKKERILYWISKGAQPSATMNNMLINAGVIKGEKQRVVRGKSKEEAKTPATPATPAAPATAPAAQPEAKPEEAKS